MEDGRCCSSRILIGLTSCLSASDWVALEATTNSWAFYDQLSPMVERVFVANCYKMKLISASAAKTDRHDALVLAKLLAANLLPTVWVPPQHVRELRNLTRHRSKLVWEHSIGNWVLTSPIANDVTH